jgi:Ubiquitin family
MYEWTGISIRHQKLLFSGHDLEDNRTLSYYKVYEDCTINVLRVRGVGDSDVPFESSVGWRTLMNHLELDHYSNLLGKVFKIFRRNEGPHLEVQTFDISLN